jgi:hypothetical protein
VAAAQLFTTRADREAAALAFAAKRRKMSFSTLIPRWPRSPDGKSNSRLQYPLATSSILRMAAWLSGARPRFVCRMTPVALMTERRDCARSLASSTTTLSLSCSIAVCNSASVMAPCFTRPRSLAITRRDVSMTRSSG